LEADVIQKLDVEKVEAERNWHLWTALEFWRSWKQKWWIRRVNSSERRNWSIECQQTDDRCG